jgi:biotin operon repressor
MRYERALAIANRHERLIELLREGAFASPRLAEKLGVSEQTVYRDIDFLKHRGLLIRSQRNSDGWAYHLLEEPATVLNGRGESRT